MENAGRMEIRDDESVYSDELVELAKNPKHFGRMNDPTAGAYVKGPCGEEMEFYLVIKDKTIEEVKFYTEGCLATRICGSMTAHLAMGKTLDDVLDISPRKVIDLLKGLPENDRHCSILAVSTLHKAIADYLLKP